MDASFLHCATKIHGLLTYILIVALLLIVGLSIILVIVKAVKRGFSH